MTKQDLIRYFENNNLDGYELILDDRQLLKLFFTNVYWRNQFIYTKGLYIEKFIPASVSIDSELEQELNKIDKYGLKIEIENLSSANETVRFGYIALYHKYESFAREYISQLTEYFLINEKDLTMIFKNKLDLNILKPKKGIIYKFSWICACVKHYNSLASKSYPPDFFINYPKNQKIIISPEQFILDCNELIIEFNKIVQVTFLTLITIDEQANLQRN